jgi:anti-sigma regulatory factor (Ser/Thr protein kinase)
MANDADPVTPQARFDIEHDDTAGRRARKALDDLFSEPDDPIADDVRLAASELVNNVVQHTADGGELRVWDPKPDVPLRLEVEDTECDTVPAIPTEPRDDGGRGLAIVDAVADEWGVEPLPDGKIVWAEFDRHRRNEPD